MFRASLIMPGRPSDARSERSSKLILLWITIIATIAISFLCLSPLWASVITVAVLISMISFTWYSLNMAPPPRSPPETEPVEVVHRAVENGGLNPSDIADIPSFCYERNSNGDLTNRNGSDRGHLGWLQCAVCISTVKERETVRQLPTCKHVFHAICIDKWLQSHLTCPMCRADVKSSMGAA